MCVGNYSNFVQPLDSKFNNFERDISYLALVAFQTVKKLKVHKHLIFVHMLDFTCKIV